MKLKQIMTQQVEIIHPDISLKDAAEMVRNLDIGCLPIGENDRVVGMITDRDIIVRAIAGGKDPASTRVRDIMTTGIKYCFENDDVKKAEQVMEDNHIRRVMVMNKDKRIAGIVSLGDMATNGHDRKLSAEVLERVSEHMPA